MNTISPISALTSNSQQTLATSPANEPQQSFLEALRDTERVSTDLRNDPEVKEKFTQFFGNAMFGQALASMRKTVDKPAYFHGGRGEEVFQQELDRTLVEHVTAAAGERFTEPMFELFALQRR